ncbi:multicopper oxidase family protein [Pengzhenrongella sicca]|uniref:multicopper oxidase family protein n=1 Tax=Pengzhenrongella sicca TaxID=2819238 RepID=UPI001D0C3FC9|nr:multicopper oxidase family protein [Pengzhenrongella sicca]
MVAAVVATLVVVAPVTWFWSTSLVPSTYSVLGMGYVDAGGGQVTGAHADRAEAGWGGPPARPGDVSVATLTGPADAEPDVAVTLEAAAERITLPDGTVVEGYTIGGTTPGPLIEATQGDLVEVTLRNASVPDGVTLHWHGVDVPNAEDGVAGVTQEAVPVGGEHVYRFVAQDAGTYWYHSHQVSHRQVRLGLLGPLVVHPRATAAGADEAIALLHTYAGTRTINGTAGQQRHVVAPGTAARIRVINTDNAALRVWVAGAGFALLAVDGRDLTGATPVRDVAVVIGAGGRADLEITAPADGSAAVVRLGGGADLVVGPAGSRGPSGAAARDPGTELDLLGYGTPAALGFDPQAADRTFELAIGRRFGFVAGRPGLHWTINGHLFPDLPMFVVAEGDVVRMTISNSSGQAHPMHLHGHHVVVLSRDGVAATGGPWWTDSLEVRDGEEFEVAFVADNPGVWMDHCHNLPHAQQGLVAHLAYTGVSEPFRVGGAGANRPE